MRLGILTSHPIQYQAPWFRALAAEVDLEVFFSHRQSPTEQGKAGFGVAFDWDVDLLSGYQHRFLKNVSARPGVGHFFGCDTPEIREIISGKQKAESRKQKAEGGGRDFSFQLSAFSVSPFDAFIVTGWHLKSYWQAVRACRRAGVPVLVRGDSQLHTPRSWLKRLAKEIAYRILLRQFDGFLTVGKRNREYLAHYGVPERKMFFVPHFVDNEWFGGKAETVRKQRAEIRKQWGADEETLVALFVGKFIPKKRPQDLLRAVAMQNAKLGIQNETLVSAAADPCTLHPAPCILPVFVGSGELEKELRELAVRENLRVHFAGFKNQSELPRYYAAADVLVLPSESETWGLVVNEAMACGLPAIVSDAVGCAPDLIDEGKTGYTFPVGDVDSLSRRLQQIVELRNSGVDFRPALTDKMLVYSVNTAVEGTVRAVTALSGLRARQQTSV